MTDTSIGISDESWKMLNSLKEKGDTFDDVVRKVFDYQFGTVEDGSFYLKLPFGYVYFTCYTMDGNCMIFRKERENGKPLESTGEIDITYPNIPVQEILNSVPHKFELMEEVKFGVIEGTGRMEERSDDLEPLFTVDSRFQINVIEIDAVEVEDFVEEETFWIEPGDVIQGISTNRLERISIYGEDNQYKRAVFKREGQPFYNLED